MHDVLEPVIGNGVWMGSDLAKNSGWKIELNAPHLDCFNWKFFSLFFFCAISSKRLYTIFSPIPNRATNLESNCKSKSLTD